MQHWRHVSGFLSLDRCAQIEAVIAAQAQRFVSVTTLFGLGPRYRTLRGEDIQRHLPELVDLGGIHVQPAVEAFTGRSLRRCINPGRAVRIQVFDHRAHEFRWHFDTSTAAALLTLRNTNGTQTQIVPPRWSRMLRPLYYPLFWAPGMFSLLPHAAVAAQPGDLLILHGSRVLHRGVPTAPAGDRLLLVFASDDVDQRARPWRERLNKYLNAGSYPG